MFLLKTIQKSIEKCVLEYVRMVAEQYELPEDELLAMWTDLTKMRIKTASNGSKRMSPWLQFCKEERIRLKGEEPTLKFGEISKRIGEKWSAMSAEERQAYIQNLPSASNEEAGDSSTTSPTTTGKTTVKKKKAMNKEEDAKKKKTTTTATTTTTKKVVSSKKQNHDTSVDEIGTNATVAVDTDPSTMWTRENLEKMKIDDLRELCGEVQLSKSGKKSDLIDRLLNSIQYSTNMDDGGWKKVDATTNPHSDSSESEFEYPSDTDE